MHFLCAEDNELNAEILTELLKIKGAECTICENGEKVVKTFEQSVPGTYDMILMDVQMPVMNGYDAARAIRRSLHKQAGTIPIIAMTANAFSEDMPAFSDSRYECTYCKARGYEITDNNDQRIKRNL